MAARIRILVAFEEDYRAYRDALSAAVKILRPDVEVMTVEPGKVAGAARRFAPDIVIGNGFEEADLEGVAAWVELPVNPTRSTRVNIDGDYSEMVNPTLDELLVAIEEVAQLS